MLIKAEDSEVKGRLRMEEATGQRLGGAVLALYKHYRKEVSHMGLHGRTEK